jgi:hypothetical protein
MIMKYFSRFRVPMVMSLIAICAASLSLLLLPTRSNDVALAKDLDEVVMQQKLALSQEMLRHLTLKDFNQLYEVTDKLMAVGKEAQWLKMPSSRYSMFAEDFRYRLEQLKAAAEDENIQGATLHYTSLVRTCVECHEEIRDGKSLARTFEPFATRELIASKK